jgi:hypothetical protein
MAQRRGFEVKVKINAVAYAVREVALDHLMPANDASNTEGVPGNPNAATPAPGYMSKVGDVKGYRITLTSATFDDAANPFLAPLAIDQGSYVSIEIFWWGPAGKRDNFPSCLVTGVSHRGTVPGLQPVTLTAESDGGYSLSIT